MTTMTQPQRIEPGFLTQQDTCPTCEGPSTATRIVASEKDLQKPWRRHLCDACQDRAAVERRSYAIDDRPAFAVTNARLKQLAIPPKYADATLDTFDVDGAGPSQRPKLERVLRRALDFLNDWPAAPVVSLFVGGPGTGKGHISWALAREVVEQMDGIARVCVLSDVVRDLREAWSSNDPGGLSETARLSRYRTVDLLVIDEVSRHAFYGQPQQHLYDLVAWRDVQNKPTILTTNDTAEDITATLGPALASRVIGGGPLWQFGEGDYRLKLAQERRKSAAGSVP